MKYAAKRFALYMAVGLILSMQVYWMVTFACLSVLIASLALSCIDAFNSKNEPASIVFDKPHQILLLVCAIIAVMVNIAAYLLEHMGVVGFLNLLFFIQLVIALLLSIIFCFHFYKTKAIPRLFAYLLVGLTAAIFPFGLGIVMGFPIILTAGVLLVSTDVMSKQALLSAPVFTKPYLVTYFSLLALIILYVTVMFSIS